MKKVLSVICGALSVAALSGCCMMLEESSQPKIKEIVEKHQANVNRKQELDVLCGKAWVICRKNNVVKDDDYGKKPYGTL